MYAGCILVSMAYPLRHQHAKCKCDQRKKVSQCNLKISHHKMLAHENHISCLGVGEHLISGIVCICILKSPRKRKYRTEQECFGCLSSLFFPSLRFVSFLSIFNICSLSHAVGSSLIQTAIQLNKITQILYFTICILL